MGKTGRLGVNTADSRWACDLIVGRGDSFTCRDVAYLAVTVHMPWYQPPVPERQRSTRVNPVSGINECRVMEFLWYL